MRNSWLARVSLMLYQLSWRTPLHKMRITGKLPLKLLAVPADPLPGDEVRDGHPDRQIPPDGDGAVDRRDRL